MSADQAALDAAELVAAGALAVALHRVPMTVDEIVRLMRDQGHDVDEAQVMALLRAAGCRPRWTAHTSAEIRSVAARRVGS